jgi:hypothetical protein
MCPYKLFEFTVLSGLMQLKLLARLRGIKVIEEIKD